MPTTKLTLRNHTVEIEGSAEEITRIIQGMQAQPALARDDPPLAAVQSVAQRIEEVTDLEIAEPAGEDITVADTTPPSGTLADFTPAPGPARRAPRIESDPEIRDRQRQAAANAREALAARRAAEKLAKETATPLTPEALSSVPPAARRGRPPKAASPVKTAADLSGDREEGDTEHSADTEPADPHDPPVRINGNAAVTPTMSSAEKQQCIFAGMREVSQVSTSGMEAVKQTVATFGVTKIKDVPLDRLDELWIATESLCGTFNVQFPPT